MVISHKIELRPTARQSEYLRRCCGVSRHVYNQLVTKWKSGEKYNRKAFQKFCSTMRQSTPWMQDVSCRAVYEAADDFHSAISNFFRTCKTGAGKWSPPKFKKRGQGDHCRFSHSEQFSVNGRSLRIQGMKSRIGMRECVRFDGRIRSVTIKPYCGRWYAAFIVEVEDSSKPVTTREPSVGIDFGLKSLAVLSNGEVIENPRPLARSLNRLRRRQRQASRRYVSGAKQQSNRYKKAVAAVARIHKKVADQRSAAQHAFTSAIVNRFDKITIEDLNVSGMRKNRRLSRAISDASWSTLRWQLEYKSKMAGVELVIADRWFASSKTCSGCGHKVEKLSLSQRRFDCPECGLSLDRDLNAAINLDRYEPTPPIRGSRKTDDVGMCKTASVAVLSDVVNINPRKNEGLCQSRSRGYGSDLLIWCPYENYLTVEELEKKFGDYPDYPPFTPPPPPESPIRKFPWERK